MIDVPGEKVFVTVVSFSLGLSLVVLSNCTIYCITGLSADSDCESDTVNDVGVLDEDLHVTLVGPAI